MVRPEVFGFGRDTAVIDGLAERADRRLGRESEVDRDKQRLSSIAFVRIDPDARGNPEVVDADMGGERIKVADRPRRVI